MIAVPYSVHGWSPDRTATKDPRVPVKCDWCLGARVLLEMDHRGAFGASLVLVVCARCDGAGEYRRERRTR